MEITITSFGQEYTITNGFGGLDVIKKTKDGADMSHAIFNLVFDAMELGQSFEEATEGFFKTVVMHKQNF